MSIDTSRTEKLAATEFAAAYAGKPTIMTLLRSIAFRRAAEATEVLAWVSEEAFQQPASVTHDG